MTPKFEFEVVESGEPRREETPDVFLRRVHEGENRALRLLALDRPDLALGFDARFSARLDTLRLSEREALESAVDVAWTAGQAARLDALLALDRTSPSAKFDAHLRHRLRQVQTEDAGLRTVAADVLRLPALPQRHWPNLDRAVAAVPRWRRNFKITAALAAVALAVTFWFARRVEDLNPPDDDLEMVAHLDLLERYEALEVFEALRDEAVFEVVAAGISHETPVETPALTPPVPAAASAPPSENAPTFDDLPIETRQALRERWQRLREQPAAAQESLRHHWRRFLDLPPGARAVLQANHARLGALSAAERARLDRLYRRLTEMNTDDRARFATSLDRWRALEADTRRRLKDRFRARGDD
jgi:hypothetical protein